MAQPAVPERFELFSNEVGQHTSPALRADRPSARRIFFRVLVGTCVVSATALAAILLIAQSAPATLPS